jgi:Mrp family chromosome partitioning ATPase
MVDGIILVVKSASTRRESVRRATEQLEERGAPIVGIAFSDVKLNNGFPIRLRR